MITLHISSQTPDWTHFSFTLGDEGDSKVNPYDLEFTKIINSFFKALEDTLTPMKPLSQRLEAFSSIKPLIDHLEEFLGYPGHSYAIVGGELMESYFSSYDDPDYPILSELGGEDFDFDFLMDGIQEKIRDGIAFQCEGVPGGFHWIDVFYTTNIPDWVLDQWEEDPSSQPEDIRKLNLLPVMRALRENK